MTKVNNIFIFLFLTSASAGHCGEAPKTVKSAAKPVAKVAAAPAPGPTERAPSGIDSNKALEVRGQSRNLSMMLVLKNGKENIDFIKVRKDYNSEIKDTPF